MFTETNIKFEKMLFLKGGGSGGQAGGCSEKNFNRGCLKKGWRVFREKVETFKESLDVHDM